MKKTLLFSALLLLKTLAFGALNPQSQASVYEHLKEVNQQWRSKAASVFSNGSIRFATDIDRIQFHLLQVEKLLRNADVSNLVEDQQAKRLQMLDVLHRYALERNFPVNSFHSERQPYFIDIYGTHCAVGYLVKISGFGSVSREISSTQNYAYVKEINSAALLDWSQEYGFSMDELALIQPTYGPTESYDQVQNGANGNVSVMRTIYDPQSQAQALYVAGNFTTLNDLPCLSIGKYVNNQLSCLDNGIDGKVVEIVQEGTNVVVFGEFTSNGAVYPVARYNGTTWTYEEITGRPGARATAALSKMYPGVSRKIAINHPTDPQKQEIWEYNAGTWNLFATVNGTVYVIQEGIYKIYAGAFDEITFSATPTTVYESKNALVYADNQWVAIDDHVSDTIFAAYNEGQVLFLSGSGSAAANRSNVCVSRYLNGVCQPLVLASQFDNGYAVVRDIDYYDGYNIMLAGQFSNYNMMAMYLGRNIMRLNTSNNQYSLMSELNKPVHSIGRIGNSIFFGGEFTGNVNNPNLSLSRLVKLRSSVGLNEVENESFQVSPNPSEGLIQISGNSYVKKVTVSDLQGKVWIEKRSTTEIDGSDLPSGVYMIRIESETGHTKTVKWVKN